MKKFAYYTRFARFIVFLIPLFLVFMGIKVPDFSRPHKPKPMRRAMLDKTPSRTIVESAVKVDVDPVLPLQPVTIALAVLEFPLEAEAGYLPAPQLSVTPLPPRAPPA